MGSLGMPEILLILVIALIVFGPRKLPELGKTLGQSLAQFRRASEDFKRQWEDEVAIERQRIDAPPAAPIEAANQSVAASASWETIHASGSEEPSLNPTASDAPTIAHHEEAPVIAHHEEAPVIAHHEEASARETKRDWM